MSTAARSDNALFGMWVFLATEVLFFAPLFFGYVHGRVDQPEAFATASHHMHVVLGTLNTALLLTSSFTMALAVRSTSRRKFLVMTALLGLAFLGVKAYEYASEWSAALQATGGEAKFYFLYYTMTGVHALHLAIGIGVLAWLALRAKPFAAADFAPVEVAGLYWHFVDIVWVFLYPMFYLLERYAA